MYAHHYIRSRRLPGVALVGLVMLVAISVTFAVKGIPSPKNTESTRLERLDVANVRDQSLTVFWRTKEATKGYVQYGGSSEDMTQVAYDELDSSTTMSPRKNHVVQLKGLKPSTHVYFKVFVDGSSVGQSADLPYTAETSRPLASSIDIEPVYGDVVRQNGMSETDAVVILQIGDSKPLLTRTSKEGTFLFSLCCVLNSQNDEPLYPADASGVRLSIIAEDGTEKIEEGVFEDIHPLAEALILDSKLAQLQPIVAQDSVPQVLAVTDTVKKLNPVDFIFPQEGALIPGKRPLVRGVGEPHTEVKGRFNVDGRIFQVEVDDKRNWVYQPSFDLTPGNHTVDIQTQDAAGNTIKLTRAFSILKSGEAVLGDATGSGEATPSAEPTQEPTDEPTSTPEATVELTSTPPVTGSNMLPITLVSLVLVVIGAGIILLF